MSSKTTPTREGRQAGPEQPREEERVPAGESTLVLRDESDEIIDNLKQQLSALQSQLHRYRAQGGTAGGGTEPPGAEERRALDLELTPHIAERLHVPAEELTGRLERLIGKVDDPTLKAELEQARNTASFLEETFRRIGERHGSLTDSLTADALDLAATDFCERLDAALRQRALGVRVAVTSPLPAQVRLSPQSAITVLTTLAELAGELFGQTEQMTVACPGLDDAAEGDGTHLVLQIAGDRPWGDVAQGEAVSAVAIRAGARTRRVVDLLYVEKIVEMRGGWLDFHRQEDRVRGFTVHLPITLLRKEPRVAAPAQPAAGATAEA